MSVWNTMEYFPLQMCCMEDLADIVAEVSAGFADKPRGERVDRERRELARLVHEALKQVFLQGEAAKSAAMAPVSELWQRLEEQVHRGELAPTEWAEIREDYLRLLDALYGAFFRHLLCRLPTTLFGGQGRFTLDRVRFSRFVRLHDKNEGRPTLERLLDFVCQGGPQFEVEFVWEPLGKQMEKTEPEWRRRAELGAI